VGKRVKSNVHVKTKKETNKSTEQRKSDFREYKKKVHKMEHIADEQSDTLSEGEESLHVLSISDNGHGYWVTPLLDGNAVRMQLDTGAAIYLLSEAIYKEKLHHLILQPTKMTLKTYTGELVPVRGSVIVTVELNKQKVKLPLYIVKGNHPALLGRTWLEKIKLNWQEIHVCQRRHKPARDVEETHGCVQRRTWQYEGQNS
jgi:hypothetical protein